jgi:hypothetical protein
VAYSWLGPFFFVELGSIVLIDGDIIAVVAWKSIIFFVMLFIGQFFSAALAAKFVPGGFTWSESWMIGFGMMGRAELFFVVLDLCYRAHSIMDNEMFCTFSVTAMLMNISVPICIALYRPYFIAQNPGCIDAAKVDHGPDCDEHGKPVELKDKKHGKNKHKNGDEDGYDNEYADDLDEIGLENTSEASDFDNNSSFQKKKKRKGVLPMVCGCLRSPA